MIELLQGGAYLVNGMEIVEDTNEAAAAIKAKTGKDISKQEAAKIYSCEVLRAKEYKDTVFFDVNINGVSIYGCRFVEGKNGDFVSFPSYKGSDGKYYSHAYIKLDEATVSLIDEQIDKLLEA